ncbi:IclR family transcriptional regulator [Persephonella sp.]
MKKKGTKTSIEKALDLIEALKENDNLGVTELSNILGLNKNNVFRLLATLEVKGLIEQDQETGHYRLGMKFLHLEHSYIKNLKFLKKARGTMRELRNEIGETVYISILHENSVIYLFAEESKKPVIVNSRIARRFDAEKTAAGRTLLKAKKEKGFIVDYEIEKSEPEVSELATVIRDETGMPIAALSIVAPSFRLTQGDIDFYKVKLVKAAKKITEKFSTAEV